jgi:acyl-CoA dehydrogenase family protein 9
MMAVPLSETGCFVSDQKEKTGFLEELYLSGFDSARFDAMVLSGEEPAATRIIDEYRALIKDFPPDVIEKEGRLPDDLMEGMKKVGLFGLNIPAAYGGVGLGIPGYLKVLEAVARTDMSLALIPTAHLSIGLKGIILFGSEEQKKKYLTRAATGEMIFAYALTEPDTGSDAQHIDTQAQLADDGSHYLLNGRKAYITNANYAGGMTVFAQLDPKRPGHMGAFIVETGWEGVSVGKDMPKMGLKVSSTATIGFKDVKVPVENLLGEPGDGFRIAMTVLNYGRLGLGAASVGVMEQSLADMLKRSASRKQFGEEIGSFPLIQEKLVRARVHAWVAGCMTAMTSLILEEDPLTNAAMESSHTKLYGTTRGWNTLYDALQVAGGSGYLATQPYEKRMRDFRVTTVFEGTTEIHSIYPALFLLRTLGKRLGSGRGKMAQVFTLLKELLHRYPWPLTSDDPVLRRAARLARRNARAVRRCAHLALLFYGRKAVRREFLLRRITHLSLNAYGILSCLVMLETGARSDGRRRGEELAMLRYFLEETQETLKREGKLFDRPKERIHRRIWKDLAARREKERKGI